MSRQEHQESRTDDPAKVQGVWFGGPTTDPPPPPAENGMRAGLTTPRSLVFPDVKYFYCIRTDDTEITVGFQEHEELVDYIAYVDRWDNDAPEAA